MCFFPTTTTPSKKQTTTTTKTTKNNCSVQETHKKFDHGFDQSDEDNDAYINDDEGEKHGSGNVADDVVICMNILGQTASPTLKLDPDLTG